MVEQFFVSRLFSLILFWSDKLSYLPVLGLCQRSFVSLAPLSLRKIEGVLVVLQSPIILHFFKILVSTVNSERLTRADRLANGYLTER